jgi:uncharacterized phage protein gp47/JayE
VAAIAAVDSAAYPSPEEVRSQILTDIRYAYDAAGIPANVDEGSDHWIRATAYGARVSIAIHNGRLSQQAISPLSAEGNDLIELAAVFGVYPRDASKASGFVIVGVNVVASVTIPEGHPVSAPNGERYTALALSPDVPNAGTVEIIAVNAGEAGNQPVGTTMRWELSSIGNLKTECTVDVGGIDGGEPADDTERLRTRLLRRLAFPGVGGSWSQIAQWAEESSAAIEAAFVYPSVRGPGSYDVALTKEGGDRTVPAATSTAAKGYIVARMPGHADLNVTTVNPAGIDVLINVKLPLPALAGGAGGGFRDSVPWPSTADAVLAKVAVVASGGTVLTVDSTSADPPMAGQHFGIWNPAGLDENGEANGAMAEFLISSVGGVSGAYVITINTPLSDSPSFVAINMYVSVGAINLKQYAAAFRDQMALLGPGEKTASPDILPRGRRQPGPEILWPSALTSVQLGRLTNVVKDSDGITVSGFPEMLDASYAARYAEGTTTPMTDAPVATTTADAPRILSLTRLAFRRQV